MKCPTHLISDAPESDDSFGPHRRIAEAIVELLRTEKGGKSIGLEGSYGSGKTTIVNLIRTELKNDSDFLLIPFDVWAHEGDPLRRTFLETLIREVKKVGGWINEEEWDRHLSIIAQRREEKTTKTVPQLKPIAKAIGLSLFLIPFGIAFLNAAARDLVTIDLSLPISWKFVIGTVLTTFPLLLFLTCWMGTKAFGKPTNNEKDDSLWALLLSKTVTEEQSETTKTPNPTSIEFEDTFKDLMREALVEPDRRVLLVLDNLDRVEPDDALSIWATLQTFLQHSPYSSEEWFERLWVLVLYDPEGIGRLWEKEEAPTTVVVKSDFYTPIIQHETRTKRRAVTSSFLDKSFQSRFSVPPPALSDWHAHLIKLLKEALPEHGNTDYHEIYRVIATHSAKEKIVPTIRRLKLYVNQIGTIHRQWQHTYTLSHVAYYVLFHDEGDDKIEWFLKHPEEGYKSFLGEDLRESLAALAFNIEKEKALQFLLGDRIRDALTEGDVQKLQEYAKFHGGFWEVLERVVQGHSDWRDGRWGKILHASYCLHQSHILDSSERPDEALSVVNELVNAASGVERWWTFDDRKAKGLAALCQWRQEKDFILTLLKAVPESLFLLKSEDYKAIDIRSWTNGLRELHSEFEPLGLSDVYSEGIVIPLKSVLNKHAINNGDPTISAETNTILEVLFELHYFDAEAQQYLSELTKETGFILRRLHHAISQLPHSHDKESVIAAAWCLFILLRSYPDATKQSIYLSWKEQRDSVLKFLELKSFEQADADSTAEAEDAKQSEIAKKNMEAVVKGFTELLIQHNELYLIFRVLDAEPASKPFVLQCLLYLIKDTEHAKTLFTTEVLVERWSFLYHEFTGSDYMYPTLFDKLVQQALRDSGLVKFICETKFDPRQAGLYKALATNLGENDHRTQEFRHWCMFGLQSVERELWVEELNDPRDLLRLALFLSATGVFLGLGESYKDALVEHAKSVIAGEVAQDFVGGDPVTARHPLGKMADPLGQGAIRKDFRKELYELAAKTGGEIDERFFFDMYEEELSDPDIVLKDERTFRQLFIPLFHKRNARGLRWVANLLSSNQQWAKNHPDRQSIETFKKLVKTALEERAFNEAGPYLGRIAQFLGVKYDLGQQSPDLSKRHEMIEKTEKVQRLEFRDERLRVMRAGEALSEMPLDDHPWIILHLIPTEPLASSNIETIFDFSALTPKMEEVPDKLLQFRPIVESDAVIGGKIKDGELTMYAYNSVNFNQDGSDIKAEPREEESAYSYLRIFKDGTVEAVRATYYANGKRRIPGRFKRDLVEAASRYLTIQGELTVQPPIALILTLTGLKDKAPKGTPLYFPEILIPSFEFRNQTKLAKLMDTIFSKIPDNVIDQTY